MRRKKRFNLIVKCANARGVHSNQSDETNQERKVRRIRLEREKRPPPSRQSDETSQERKVR